MTRRETVLVVEDDAAIRRGIVDALGFEGYQVLQAADGPSAAALAGSAEYDLLLLDLVLPHGDGFEILRLVRDQRPTASVIILTAMGDEADRVRGLRQGADDYVVKPFSVKELLARVEAVLRRAPQRPLDVQSVRLPDGEADLQRREVRFADGYRCELSSREADVLRYLAVHAGRIIARDELLSNVWRINPRGAATRTVDMLMVRLREKLRDDSAAPRILLTVRGKGYTLAADAGSS